MNRHTPVLLDKVLEVLHPSKGEVFADLTAGYGGHSAKILRAVGSTGFGYLFDKDKEAIKALNDRFKDVGNVKISQVDFADINWHKDLPSVDMILADIGVSSPQIDEAERGFSFQQDGPLDMRMNQDQELTAFDLVNNSSASDLADILYLYAEEYKSRRIASAIVHQRKQKPIQTTTELAELISNTTGKSGKIHPATKTFQALRIAVNDELGALQSALESAPSCLKDGGRIAIISFHSLEDRLVKQAFKALCSPVKNEFGQVVSLPLFRSVTKKPIMGSEFDKTNPRARSAKLRVVEKIN